MTERARRMRVAAAVRTLRGVDPRSSVKVTKAKLVEAVPAVLGYLADLENDLALRECDQAMQRVPGDRCGRCWPCRLSGNGKG